MRVNGSDLVNETVNSQGHDMVADLCIGGNSSAFAADIPPRLFVVSFTGSF
jgi:hypothetical protein